MAILALFLSVSGLAQANDALTDLVNSSQVIADQLDLGYRTVAGMQYNASLGYMAPTGMADDAKISAAQRTAYNDAMSAMADLEFYTAEDFLLDQGDLALANMETAIDTFTEAATEIAVVLELTTMAEEAAASGSNVDAQEVAEFAEANEAALTLSSDTVTEYNDSLEDIEGYAQEAAAFIGIANDADSVAFFDNSAEQANSSFVDEVNASFQLENNWVKLDFDNANWAAAVYFDGTNGLDLFKSSTAILTDGEDQTFYTTSPSYVGYECFFYGTDCD
jgi:hypothetical protein